MLTMHCGYFVACAAGGGDYSKVRHMFDGYGCLSRLRVEGGRAWGNQRYVQSKAYKAYTAQGEHGRRCAAAWPSKLLHRPVLSVNTLGFIVPNNVAGGQPQAGHAVM